MNAADIGMSRLLYSSDWLHCPARMLSLTQK